jgi:hypothetical protein
MTLDRERTSREEEEEDAMVELAASRGETYHAHADQMRLTGRVIKRVRDLTKTIDEHGHATEALQRKTNDLTERIKTLTVVLVVLTVVIALLTVVMAWPTIASLWPKGGGR